MRSILSTFIFLYPFASMAQLPDGSIAPDFTGTDLNGNEHHLYEYLDQGYTVILEFSATWCGPCWDYHQEHHMENLYLQYGPGTTEDHVMVLFIEGDDGTPTENLYGAGWSAGDWVTGTDFPIIDDHLIAELYGINGYPYVYKVCPDRIATDIGTIPLAELWAEVQECPFATLPADAFLLPTPRTQAACANTSTPLQVMLQNNGLQPYTSSTIEAYHDGILIGSIAWTGDLPTYNSELVNVGSFTPTTAGTYEITYQITTADGDPTNDLLSTELIVDDIVLPGIDLTLEVHTDAFPFETSWKIYDLTGAVVAQNQAPYNVQHNLFTHDLQLQPDQCYVFEIYDNYGDGICCSTGEGYYRLIANGQVLVEGGDFEEQAAHPFKTALNVSIPYTHLMDQIKVHPIPSTGSVMIDFPANTSGLEVTISDLRGARVFGQKIDSSQGPVALDLSHLADGLYHLQIRSGTITTSHKIIIAR